MDASIGALIAIGLCALLVVVYHQHKRIQMLQQFNADVWKIVDLRREQYNKMYDRYEQMIQILNPDLEEDFDDAENDELE
jgi:hypothetical protein